MFPSRRAHPHKQEQEQRPRSGAGRFLMGAGAQRPCSRFLASRFAMRSCTATKRASCPSRNAQSPLLLPLPPPPARYPNPHRRSSNCKDATMCLSGVGAAAEFPRGCAGAADSTLGSLEAFSVARRRRNNIRRRRSVPFPPLKTNEHDEVHRYSRVYQPNSSWGGPKSLGLITLTVPPSSPPFQFVSVISIFRAEAHIGHD